MCLLKRSSFALVRTYQRSFILSAFTKTQPHKENCASCLSTPFDVKIGIFPYLLFLKKKNPSCSLWVISQHNLGWGTQWRPDMSPPHRWGLLPCCPWWLSTRHSAGSGVGRTKSRVHGYLTTVSSTTWLRDLVRRWGTILVETSLVEIPWVSPFSRRINAEKHQPEV